MAFIDFLQNHLQKCTSYINIIICVVNVSMVHLMWYMPETIRDETRFIRTNLIRQTKSAHLRANVRETNRRRFVTVCW